MRIYRLIPGHQPSFLPLAVDWEKDSIEEEANESEQQYLMPGSCMIVVLTFCSSGIFVV